MSQTVQPLSLLNPSRQGPFAALLVLAAACLPAPAQYVGKVAESRQPVLRATAVYQYTGSLLKPNASRLIPVAVWDGEHYQPGGLYLARPEPLAVAPGTQYVLEQSGVPQGLFDVGSAAQANGAWVGLGRAKTEVPVPAPKLQASRQLPVLTGGSGKGKASDASPAETKADNGPVLHRKADPGSGSPTNGGGGSDPTLHRRDTGGNSGSNSGDASGSPDPDRPTLHRNDSTDTPEAPAPDPDRPTLHRKDPDTAATPTPLDPDRPTLHRHADPSAATPTAPDPDRPHLRYGAVIDDARAQPAMLTDPSVGAGTAKPGAPTPGSPGANGVPIGQAVAVSDTRPGEPHSFRYSWPSPSDEATARQSMHALALNALAGAVQESFGPAAGRDAALRRAGMASQGGFGPGARRPPTSGRRGSASKPAVTKSVADPLLDPQFSAWELSPGGGTTYVYTAHTAPGTGPDPIQRYVTVVAVTDFSGKPQLAFSQTTRSDTLAQTPALHLIDAVDTDGDGRAELLFGEQNTPGAEAVKLNRAFAIYSVAGGKAVPVYSTEIGTGQ